MIILVFLQLIVEILSSQLSLSDSSFWKDNNIDYYHQHGFTGQHERICILDSGIHPGLQKHLKHPVKAFDFTSDNSTEDFLNHGTSAFSILGSTDKQCPGVIPNSIFISFKVVDKHERILTKWILKALEQSIIEECTAVVICFGGRDLDELSIQQTINKVLLHSIPIIISAGNEGPSYGSVLSPADHPGVFSIGASINQTSLLSSSSRGYRSHSMQRFLPEFIIHGFHIPCFTSSLTCKGISGTSIAAPLFTGLLVLQQQEYLSHHPSFSRLSPGSLHCLLHNQSLSFCSFPSSISIPSSQVPFIPQPLYSLSLVSHSIRVFSSQSRYLRLSLFSSQPTTAYSLHSNCSWLEIVSLQNLAPYVQELLLLIHPVPQKGFVTGLITVNTTLSIPITIHMEGVSTKLRIGWIEGDGNTRASNGDSAFTNYLTLYQILSKSFVIDVFQKKELFERENCICFDRCDHCVNVLYITGINKQRSEQMRKYLKEQFGIITTRHGKSCSVTLHEKEFRNIHDYLEITKIPTTMQIHKELRNNQNQQVGIIASTITNWIGILGVGQIVDDMHFLSTITGKVITDWIQFMLTQNIHDNSVFVDELFLVCYIYK